jgi:hypothetical protein
VLAHTISIARLVFLANKKGARVGGEMEMEMEMDEDSCI